MILLLCTACSVVQCVFEEFLWLDTPLFDSDDRGLCTPQFAVLERSVLFPSCSDAFMLSMLASTIRSAKVSII